MTVSIGLGPSNGPGNTPANIGTFSGQVGLGSGSQIALGNNAISGNYKEHIVFTNANIGFSASNTTATLSANPVTLTTSNSSGNMSLTYDDVTPGTPLTVNSFSSNLSDGASAGLTINSTSIPMSTSLGTFNLTPQFSGSISGISFTASGSAAVNNNVANIPGTFSAVLNGSVTGSLSVAGLFNISVGTLYTLPTNTVVTFAGTLPGNLNLSDLQTPYPNAATNTDRNNMLADLAANLGTLQIPFQFVAPLSTNETYNVSGSSSGVTSINIQNTTLTANLILSNLSYEQSGQALVRASTRAKHAGPGYFGSAGLFWLRTAAAKGRVRRGRRSNCCCRNLNSFSRAWRHGAGPFFMVLVGALCCRPALDNSPQLPPGSLGGLQRRGYCRDSRSIRACRNQPHDASKPVATKA